MFPPYVKRKYRPVLMIAVEDIYSRVTTGKEIAQRIRKRIEQLKREGVSITQASLLDAADLGPSFIKDLANRNPKSSPRAENLSKIARELKVSVQWLLDGSDGHSEVTEPGRYGYESERSRKPVVQRNIRAAASFSEMLQELAEPAVIDVPEYDVRVSAGHGALITEETVRRYWGLPRSYLESLGLDVTRIAFVEIVGDSMAPALMPGDLVLLDLRSTNPALPAIYALWDGDATVCKRVEKVQGSDPPMVRIISENKAYTAYDVPAEWVNVIGRVAWFARRT